MVFSKFCKNFSAARHPTLPQCLLQRSRCRTKSYFAFVIAILSVFLSLFIGMVISARDLKKTYDRVPVFEHLSFEVCAGEALGIQGPNGSGKSTLMKILAGVALPTSGTVLYLQQGTPIEKTEQIRYIGFVAPYLQFYNELTGFENVLFSLRAKGIVPDMHRIQSLFEYFALSTAAQKLVQTYSSGMLQRLRFIQAFAAEPPVCLLDEPTATLDESGTHLLREFLRRYRHDAIVIIASNDVRDFALCTRVLCLEDFKP